MFFCSNYAKDHASTIRQGLPGGGAIALFFHPHPREFATQNKKRANARGLAQAGGGGGMGAAGID